MNAKSLTRTATQTTIQGFCSSMTSANPVALVQLTGTYSIHRLPPAGSSAATELISAVLSQPTTLFALLKSADELSLVCDELMNDALTEKVGTHALHTSGPWCALRVVGELDFALTGILASLTAPLAQANISVFAISSYNTDYLLVNAANAGAARDTLLAAGFAVQPSEPVTTHT